MACSTSKTNVEVNKSNSHVAYDSITNLIVHDLYFLDRQPTFPERGYEGFVSYIIRNYEDTSQAGIYHKVKIKFVIDKKGHLIGARIAERQEDNCCDEEEKIIKILESSPLWEPGVYKGKDINVLYWLRFSYAVSEEGKIVHTGTTLLDGTY